MNGLRAILVSLVCLGPGTLNIKPDVTNSPKNYVTFIPQPGEVVAAHNFVREKVGVPPVAWSDALAQVAQEWANKLMSAGVFMHSRDLRYGENLFQISGLGATSTAFEVVNAWASEADSYRYDTNTCRGECGHYTQLVWRDTKQVGCAVARDSRREVWVCEYAPFGNIIGERPY
jgi:pathogenesis-related protein 1